MKIKDSENKGSKKIDEVKNMDLILLVDELNMSDLNFGKSLISFPADEIVGLTPSEMIKKYNDGKFSLNLLDGFRKKVIAERDSLIQEVTTYYTSKLDFKETRLSMTPEEIVKKVELYKIRVKRLSMVFEPDYYQTITKKSNGDEYDLVKLNWIGDDGLKFIKISKTFGRKGKTGLEFSIRKVLKDFFMIDSHPLNKDKSYIMLNTLIRNAHLFELDSKVYLIEYMINDKNDFIRTALRLELWDYYDQTYLRPEKSSKIFDG